MRKIVPIIALIFGSIQLSFGQSQRLVLFEHFTQASCPPCATYNPAINTMLDANPDKVVAIKYQTSWPGSDPMNAANPTDVATRVTYYGVNSVPNSVIDGNYYNGHPASVNVGQINTRYAVPSPVNVTVRYHVIDNTAPTNDSISIHVKVKAVSALATNHVLHTVAIEREISFASAPGTNGEKKFESVMKKMLPTAAGTNLPAMAAGDSLEFDFKWNITKTNGQSVYYNVAEAAAVAFVQNKSTKATLQASYDKPRPWLALALGNGVKQTRLKAADDLSWVVQAKSNSAQDQNIFMKASATGLPAGWQLKMVVNGVELSDTTSFALAANEQKEVSLKVVGPNAGFENKKYTITLDANSKTIFPLVKTTYKFTAFTPSNILLLDYAGGSGAARFTSVFNAQAQPYVQLIADEAGKLDPAGLTYPTIKKIYYQTGSNASNNLPAENANLLDAFLSSGGNLFMMGQDIGFDLFDNGGTNLIGQDFYETRLGAIYGGDGESVAMSLGPVTNETIFASALTGTAPLAGGSTSSPDELIINAQVPNATAIIQYVNGNNDGVAAIRNHNDTEGSKSVYAGFRMEALNSSTWRTALVTTANGWFDGTLTANEFSEALKGIGNAFPNPAADQLFVPVRSLGGTVRIFDLSGKVVTSTPITEVNTNLERVNISSLKSGLYLLQIEQGGSKSDFQKITITR